jgi:hypothetical protein
MNYIHGLTPAFVYKVERKMVEVKNFYHPSFLNIIKNSKHSRKSATAFIRSLILDCFDAEFLDDINNLEKYNRYLKLYGEFIKVNKFNIDLEVDYLLRKAGVKEDIDSIVRRIMTDKMYDEAMAMLTEVDFYDGLMAGRRDGFRFKITDWS